MEFDCNMLKLQGSLLSLNKRGFFQAPDIAEPLKVLRDIFNEVTDDDIKLKMVFFMILNTDLAVLEEAKSIENLNNFICVVPPLSHHKILEIIWDLGLHPQFNIMVQNCTSCLINQLLVSLIKNGKFWNQDEYFESLYSVWCSLYVRLHNISKGFQIARDALTFAYYFEEISDKISHLLEKNNVREAAINAMGKHLFSVFTSILFMVRLYNDDKYNFKENNLFNILDNLKVGSEQSSGLLLQEPSKTCLRIIFQLLQKVVEPLTVDLWMSLSEIHLDRDSTSHAQKLIGETIYYICEEASNLFPNLLNCLTTFKIKPQSDADKIKDADLNEIVKNVRSGKKLWFKALINYSNTEERNYEESPAELIVGEQQGKACDLLSAMDPFKDGHIINCVMEHLNQADSDDINLILNKCVNVLSRDQILMVVMNIKNLIKTILKTKQNDVRIQIFQKIFVEKPFVGCKLEATRSEFDADDYADRLTELFNKISGESELDIGEISGLCLESRERTLARLCELGLTNSKQSEVCLKAVDSLKGAFTSPRFENSEESVLEFVLMQILKSEEIEYNDDSLVSFFHGLESRGLIDWLHSPKLLHVLNVYLEKEDYKRVSLLLQLIQLEIHLIVQEDTKTKLCLLVFLSQVLDRLTWDLTNFSTGKADGLAAAGTLVSNVIAGINNEDKNEGLDFMWVMEKLTSCSKITQSYFCDLWFKFGYRWTASESLDVLLLTMCHSYDKIVNVEKLIEQLEMRDNSNNLKYSIILSLAVVLPRLPFPDWEAIFSHLQMLNQNSNCFNVGNETVNKHINVLDIFSFAVYLVTLEFNKNKSISVCYEYCLRNFGRLIKAFVKKTLKNNETLVLEKIIFILSEINDEAERENCYLTLSPVINSLIEAAKGGLKGSSKVDQFLKVLNVNKAEKAVNKDKNIKKNKIIMKM